MVALSAVLEALQLFASVAAKVKEAYDAAKRFVANRQDCLILIEWVAAISGSIKQLQRKYPDGVPPQLSPHLSLLCEQLQKGKIIVENNILPPGLSWPVKTAWIGKKVLQSKSIKEAIQDIQQQIQAALVSFGVAIDIESIHSNGSLNKSDILDFFERSCLAFPLVRFSFLKFAGWLVLYRKERQAKGRSIEQDFTRLRGLEFCKTKPELCARLIICSWTFQSHRKQWSPKAKTRQTLSELRCKTF